MTYTQDIGEEILNKIEIEGEEIKNVLFHPGISRGALTSCLLSIESVRHN